MKPVIPERLSELLSEDATEGLSVEQLEEMQSLLAESPDIEGTELAEVAALVQLSFLKNNESTQESLPSDLANRIKANAQIGVLSEPKEHKTSRSSESRWSWFGLPALGWYATAALAIALLVTRVPETPLLTLEQQVASLRAACSDISINSWTQPDQAGFENVTGDVVWCNSTQQGFMLFAGMPVNNPSEEQYQLWIVDPERDNNPVDGGVFDVTNTGDVVVPIDAKLDIIKPAAFAITKEVPGGVVVSAGPLLVVAPVET